MQIYILIIKDIGGGGSRPPPPCMPNPGSEFFRQAVALVNRLLFLPNVCQTLVRAKSIIIKSIMILPGLS